MSPHHAVMPREVLAHLRPVAGDVVVDCTLGGGGHAELVLPHVRPGGVVVGVDVDCQTLADTTARLRAAGYGPDEFRPVAGSFAALSARLAEAGVDTCDGVLVDLGISSMQAGSPSRGFSYKVPGPLDMRMDRSSGVPAFAWLRGVDEATLARLLAEHADEPHAALIARLVMARPLETTQALERCVRLGLAASLPDLAKPEIKASIRRTFQALRIAVNDEFVALDALLAGLPRLLRPGARVVMLTFHSGEDRRVKHAFRAGLGAGVFSAIAARVVRASKDETRANRRSSSAKLRWAVRAGV